MAAINEEELNFDSFTKLSLFFLRLVLFDFQPLKAEATLKEKILYHMKLNYVRLCLAVMLIAFFSMSAFGIMNSDDFVNASTSVPNATITALIGLKGMAIFLRKNDIWEIFQEMERMFDRRTGQNKKYEVKKYLDDYYRYLKPYVVVFIVFFMPIVFPVVPFLLYGTMKLSINYWFPFDVFRPERFPFVLLWTEWNGYNLSLYFLGPDAVLYALIAVIAMEFEILKVDFMSINKFPVNERAKKIAELVDRHNKLLEVSNTLQEIFDMTFLYSYVTSSLMICFIAFQLSLGDSSTYGFYIPYFFMTMGQIFLLSSFGQKLINSSEAVAGGIYHSGWEDIDDHAFKKQFMLILARSQRVQKFTAMNFTTISLSSFTTVSSVMKDGC